MSEERRLRPPDRYSITLDRLLASGCFETKHSALLFAAAVGRCFLRRRDPLGKAGEGIRWEVFERNDDSSFVYMLGLAATGTVDVLGNAGEGGDALATIFEEHAAAGLAHLQERCLDAPGDPLDNLLLLIAEARLRQSPALPGLEGLTAADLELLGGL